MRPVIGGLKIRVSAVRSRPWALAATLLRAVVVCLTVGAMGAGEPACSSEQKQAAVKVGGQFVDCYKGEAGKRVAGAVLEVTTSTPASRGEWESWGKSLLGRFGEGALLCALQLVAAAAPEDLARATPAPASTKPAIGFLPTTPASGGTVLSASSAGPGDALAGGVTTSGEPRAREAALYLLGRVEALRSP